MPAKLSSAFRLTLSRAAAAAVALFSVSIAHADCLTFAGGQACQPTVSVIVGHPTSIDVTWLPGGGIPPQSITLIRDGTAAKAYNDGVVLASASETSPIGLYKSYTLTIGNLSQNQRFTTLRLIGHWGNLTLATQAFGGAAQPDSSPMNAPTLSGSFNDGKITVSWTAGHNYDVYNVRFSSGTAVTASAVQVEAGSGTSGSYTTREGAVGSYAFIVQGCMRDFWHIFRSDCSPWSNTSVVSVTPTAPPATNAMSFPHASSGDCEMQNATIVFRSDGSGLFTAQVKTNHTHSGDIWHATIVARNGSNQDLVNLPTFDSMRMDDNHGWYAWTRTFEFDEAKYSQISKGAMNNKC